MAAFDLAQRKCGKSLQATWWHQNPTRQVMCKLSIIAKQKARYTQDGGAFIYEDKMWV